MRRAGYAHSLVNYLIKNMLPNFTIDQLTNPIKNGLLSQ